MVEVFHSGLSDPLALPGNSLQVNWANGLLYMYPSLRLLLLCSSQGDFGGGSGHCDSTVVDPNRMVSPGPAAPRGPTKKKYPCCYQTATIFSLGRTGRRTPIAGNSAWPHEPLGDS